MGWLSGLLLVVVVGIGGFLLAEPTIDSAAWKPPEPLPMTGRLAPNEQLKSADLLAQGEVYGPEDTTVDSGGVLYTGTQEGWIVRVWPDGRHLQDITSANPHDGLLYFGSLHNDRIGRMALASVPGLKESAND